MNNNNFNIATAQAKMLEFINKYDRFLLCLHENADMDSLASNIAMYEILSSLNKKCILLKGENKTLDKNLSVFNEFTGKLHSIQNISDLPTGSYQAIILLDGARLDRFFYDTNVFSNKDIMVIDHHNGNNIHSASVRIVNTQASSTCELLFTLNHYDEKIGLDFAKAIYLGIWSDTLGLTKGISEDTFQIIHTLTKSLGKDEINNIVQKYENVVDESQIQILQAGLKNLKKFNLKDGGSVVYVIIEAKDLVDTDYNKDALMLVLSKLESCDILFVALETSEQYHDWRISVRSKNDYAQKIAEHFGGTGHAKRAGASPKSIPARLLEKNLLDFLK